MLRTSVAPSSPRATAGETARENASLASASALNVTTLVSIFVVAIFAVVTQLLTASGAISLSTTLQLTMWLVALGFIVLLAIAYMFFRVFERARETPPVPPDGLAENFESLRKRIPPQLNNRAQERAQLGQDAGSRGNSTDGPRQFILDWSPDGSTQRAEDAWIPPKELRHLDGTEYSVSTEDVFPDGCYLEPDSIRLVSGNSTGQQVYECQVLDRNPALEDRPHETVVKIRANQEPSLASMPRFGRVEFEGLTITPYVTDQEPMWIRYSLRATGLHRAAAPTERDDATWTAAPNGVSPEEVDAHVGTDGTPGAAGDTNS
jgi:hypothetical protein